MSLTQTIATSKNLTELGNQIRQAILRDVEDARLRELGASIIQKMNVPARSPSQLARAFQVFSQNHIKYFKEFPEVNAAPWVTAKWQIGDCDDKSRLIAALLKSFRIPVRLAFLQFKDKQGKVRSHVWPEYMETDADGQNGRWIALESVQPWPMGKSPADVMRAKNIPISTFEIIV